MPAALDDLLRAHGALHVGSIVETAPVGMTDGSGAFWNLAVAVPSTGSPAALQARLHDLERAAGRDRSAPGQSWRARPLDLDLLLTLDGAPVSDADLPTEPWIRPLVIELLHHLGVACGAVAPSPAGARAVHVAGRTVGPGPASLTLDLP